MTERTTVDVPPPTVTTVLASLDDFDPLVTRAMLKWPDVPACYDWLALDQRGRWRLQDNLITHERTIAFLNRHYTSDPQGCWFVQNGPQRVFVSLPGAPLVLSLTGTQQLQTHAGRIVSEIKEIIASDDGNLRCLTEFGLGLVDDRDVSALLAELTGSELPRELLDGALASPFALDTPPAVWEARWNWHGQRLCARAVAVDQLERRYRFVSHPGARRATEDTVE